MHIHILGIAGNKTAPLAISLSSLGHKVTGSDQEKIYPPYSTILKKNHITINKTPITKEIDLVIVGNSYGYFEHCRQDFENLKKLNIPYISSTEYIANNIIKPESILVAGAFGKSTITSLIAFIFTKLNRDPSYMFGANSKQIPSVSFGNSTYSIVEADENHNGLDTKPTFLYYPVKYLILTSVNWEHKESFADQQENLDAYKALIQKLPKDGVLIYNPNDSKILKLISDCQCPKIAYSPTSQIDTPLIGFHNQQNISAVIALCDYLKLDRSQVLKTIKEFQGLKKRLEIISSSHNILIIDDYAQSANRVKAAFEALNYSFPNRRIFVYFEPHATFLQHQSSVTDFSKIFNHTHQVILGKISFAKNIDKSTRTTAKDWQKISNKIVYMPEVLEIEKYFTSNLTSGDILIHFSSGGLAGLNTLIKIKKAILNIHL